MPDSYPCFCASQKLKNFHHEHLTLRVGDKLDSVSQGVFAPYGSMLFCTCGPKHTKNHAEKFRFHSPPPLYYPLFASVTLHVHGNHANATKNVTMRRIPGSLYSHGLNATLSKVFTGSDAVLGEWERGLEALC